MMASCLNRDPAHGSFPISCIEANGVDAGVDGGIGLANVVNHFFRQLATGQQPHCIRRGRQPQGALHGLGGIGPGAVADGKEPVGHGADVLRAGRDGGEGGHAFVTAGVKEQDVKPLAGVHGLERPRHFLPGGERFAVGHHAHGIVENENDVGAGLRVEYPIRSIAQQVCCLGWNIGRRNC
jgi:hypothetical protein